jgi:hypothetical protein
LLFLRRKFWFLNYRLNGKRIREATGLTSKIAAEKLRIDREKSLVTGKLHHILTQKVAVARCYLRYLRDCESRFLSVKTIQTARSCLKKLFRWARLTSVSDFTTATIKEFFSFRVKMARALAARAARRMAARDPRRTGSLEAIRRCRGDFLIVSKCSVDSF